MVGPPRRSLNHDLVRRLSSATRSAAVAAATSSSHDRSHSLDDGDILLDNMSPNVRDDAEAHARDSRVGEGGVEGGMSPASVGSDTLVAGGEGHDAPTTLAAATPRSHDTTAQQTRAPPRVRFSTDVERGQPDDDEDAGVDGVAAATTEHSTLDAPQPPSVPRRSRGYSLRRAIFAKNMQKGASESNGTSPPTPAPASPPSSKPAWPSFQRSQQEPVREPYIIPPERYPDSDQSSIVSAAGNIKGGQGSVRVTSYSCEDSRPSSSHSGPLKVARTQSNSVRLGQVNWIRQRADRFDVQSRVEAFRQGVRRHVFRIKPIPPTKDGRHICLDVHRSEPLIDERTNQHYCDNHIRSSRYSLWSFFPKQFIAQFTKLANAYFLLVSILQMIPGLSTTGTYTTIVPLLIFVGISMGKEGIDDLRRYRLDKEENGRLAQVLQPQTGLGPDTRSDDSAQYRPTKWIDIKVGDIIRIDRDQPVPADVVLLHADDANGIAYIETMALDGETNLKTKQPCVPIARACNGVQGVLASSQQVHFTVEDPNSDLYRFEGNVTVGGEKLPLTSNDVILRGSILRNTRSALGMVIYTGEECKIRMNANKNPRIKAPTLQAYVNRVVAVIVLFVLILAGACTIAYKYWAHGTEDKSWYLEQADVAYGPVFTSFLIMYNTMIPISLYVSLEIVKVGQMYFMHQDVDLYDEDSNTPVVARTSTINEELGQVSYIFSDKTGTLTNNSMHFRKLSVAGTAWLYDSDLLEEAALAEEAAAETARRRMSKGKRSAPRPSHASAAVRKSTADPKVIARARSTNEHSQRNNTGRTAEMLDYIRRRPDTVFARKARFFILGMALCHTCLPERLESGEISYQAASPDELALVNAARDFGYVVVDRQPNSMTVRVERSGAPTGPDETYEILDVIEFSSARKRMSIVLRMPDSRICVFTKGADTTLLRLLRRSSLASDKMAAVSRRTSMRKSLEAKEVLRRNSMQVRGEGIKRSLSLPRHSFANSRAGPSTRQSIDVWLRDRETDPSEAVRGRKRSEEYYTSRPSMQQRRSLALQEGRPLPQIDDDADDELVEESLAIDDAQVFERCFQHLDDFATEGLRTLLYGYRFLTHEEYRAWKEKYQEATTSLVDRQEMIERVGEEIETNLELLGATAIEDKLQKGVPEAIEKLRRANIKLWMLTGDKRETAINIGRSCHLVKDYSAVTILDSSTGNVEHALERATRSIERGDVAHSVVVVDGQMLTHITDDSQSSEAFLDLAVLADSVICCRASPKQKAFLVSAIRKRMRKSITLAIGDGANDIAMIQEAHVGIGIAGKEGLQAARISDYSIAQFRFLLKLLLVHGRWNYVRVCKYTLGTFWKETLFYLTQALYQKWNGYTGTSLYEPWGLSMFNTLFTSLPVIFLGMLEKDLSPTTLLAVPELYSIGQTHQGFNVRKYLFWAFTAVCEALMIYFVMFALYGELIVVDDNSIFPLGVMTYSAAVILINIKLQGLVIHYRTYVALAVNVISIGGWWVWNIFLSEQYSDNKIYKVPGNFVHITGQNLLWWTVLLVSVTCCITYELLIGSIRTCFVPTDVDIFQEFEKDPYARRRFEEASALEMAESWRPDPEKEAHEQAVRQREQDERVRHVDYLLERRRKLESVDSDFTVTEVEHADRAGHDALRLRTSMAGAATP
ncbi:hypothetical protein KEM52_005402 [Ascosphaera acerosa]|nr:hypothetical protein KEM52_005402 [Ascosphaera acerosa]